MEKAQLLKQLEEVGLSEKEAKVYLASLELGPSTAQNMAAKALVNRPTTYMMIESLIERGLMRKTQKNKKKVFIAQQISHLIYVLDEKKRKLEVQKKTIEKISKELNFFGSETNFPITVSFSGQSALDAVRRDLLKEKDLVREIVPIDLARRVFPPPSDDPDDRRNDYLGLFRVESISIYDGGLFEDPLPFKKQKTTKHRILSREFFPIDNEILILTEAVIFVGYENPVTSVHIYDRSIVATMNVFFSGLWHVAKDAK